MRSLAPALVVVLALVSAPLPALADRPPPNALPLSQIVRMLEERLNPAYFDQIDWDDDGYWEIEYVDQRGAKVKIKVDPVSGQQRLDR